MIGFKAKKIEFGTTCDIDISMLQVAEVAQRRQ